MAASGVITNRNVPLAVSVLMSCVSAEPVNDSEYKSGLPVWPRISERAAPQQGQRT